MDRTKTRRQAKPQPVAGRSPRRIGFIGRSDVSDAEGKTLQKIGRSISRLGHTLVSAPAKGATQWVRVGVEAEKGMMLDLQSGVLEAADHTLLYPSPRLLERLRVAYPDLEKKYNVTILQRHQLEMFWEAMAQIMAQQGIEVPS